MLKVSPQLRQMTHLQGRRGSSPALARARCATICPMASRAPGPAKAGALLCRLRLKAGLSPAELARRAGVARSTVHRLERGEIRPRRCTLSAIAQGINADQHVKILARLVAAAGGDEHLAPNGGWTAYRRTRIERGILAGTTPLPTRVARPLSLHQEADQLWMRAMTLLDKPGALNDADSLDQAMILMDRSKALREQAGPPIVLHVGRKRISAGFGVP